MTAEKIIGIVGGVGPYAGLDLARKILDQTRAGSDQEHLPIALLSLPGQISDRTDFLTAQTRENPAHAIAQVIEKLHAMDAAVVGIPCNTAHAPAIFEPILADLEQAGCPLQPLHMLREVAAFLAEHCPAVRRVGLLATAGTVQSKVYESSLAEGGVAVLGPDEPTRQAVHRAIYDPRWGIKTNANPPSGQARQCLLEAIEELRARGAQAVILGCTEIPLAIPESEIEGLTMIDPAIVLARALIQTVAPDKLRA